jgi:hypothetical protein
LAAIVIRGFAEEIMTTERIVSAGFAPGRGDRMHRRCGVLVQLIATLGLIVSLAVAGTAVTVGMAAAKSASAQTAAKKLT